MTKIEIERLDVFKIHPDDIVMLKRMALLSLESFDVLRALSEGGLQAKDTNGVDMIEETLLKFDEVLS